MINDDPRRTSLFNYQIKKHIEFLEWVILDIDDEEFKSDMGVDPRLMVAISPDVFSLHIIWWQPDTEDTDTGALFIEISDYPFNDEYENIGDWIRDEIFDDSWDMLEDKRIDDFWEELYDTSYVHLPESLEEFKKSIRTVKLSELDQ